MNLVIKVNGRNYIPVAAVPYVTGGSLSARKIIQMLVAPELFFDDRHHTVLEAYQFLPIGDALLMVHADREKLQSAADRCFWEPREPPLRAIAGMVVPEIELRELADLLWQSSSKAPPGKPAAPWDIKALLPLEVALAVAANLPVPLNITTNRKNDKQAMTDKIDVAFEQAIKDVAQIGINLDRGNMLGRKIDWQRILPVIDPDIRRAVTTLDSYFKDLGIRFRRGAKAKDAVPLLKYYGLTTT